VPSNYSAPLSPSGSSSQQPPPANNQNHSSTTVKADQDHVTSG